MATGRGDVKQSVDDLAEISGARMARAARHPQKRSNQSPFPIRHVTCVAWRSPEILPMGDFSPDHRELYQIFANPKDS